MVTLLLDSVLLCSGEEGVWSPIIDSVLARRVSGHIIVGLCSGEKGEWPPYYWTLFW